MSDCQCCLVWVSSIRNQNGTGLKLSSIAKTVVSRTTWSADGSTQMTHHQEMQKLCNQNDQCKKIFTRTHSTIIRSSRPSLSSFPLRSNGRRPPVWALKPNLSSLNPGRGFEYRCWQTDFYLSRSLLKCTCDGFGKLNKCWWAFLKYLAQTFTALHLWNSYYISTRWVWSLYCPRTKQ